MRPKGVVGVGCVPRALPAEVIQVTDPLDRLKASLGDRYSILNRSPRVLRGTWGGCA